MMSPKMGYPLPSGDAYTDELACMMVFYPDKPEYRQAFMGAYFYFGNWLAWERDADKKGADAARAWKDAIEATLGCIEMNTCETILSLLTEIRDNTGIYCCDAVDITDGDQYTDEVEDGVGDVPQNIIDAGYATGVSDWAGFDAYKCMISHVMVTNMESQVSKFEDITDTSGAVLGGVAAVAAIAAVILASGGTALVLGIVLGIAGVAGLYAALAEMGEAGLGDLVDDLADNHDILACAIYNADGSAGAVIALQDAIDDNFSATQAILLKNLNISAQLKALYAGRYDAQDIAEKMSDEGYDILDYTCDCEIDYGEWQSPLEEGDSGTLLFMVNSGWSFGTPHGNPTGNDLNGWRKPGSNPGGAAKATVIAVRDATGLTTGTGKDMTVNRITFDIYQSSAGGGGVQLEIGSDDSIHVGSVGTWTTVEYVPSTPVYRGRNDECFRFVGRSGSGYNHIDNIMVDFDGPA